MIGAALRFLTGLPVWVWALIAACVVSWGYGRHQVTRKLDDERAKWAIQVEKAAAATQVWQAKAKAQDDAMRAKEKQITDVARALDADKGKQDEKRRRDSAAADAVVDGLLRAIDATSADAARSAAAAASSAAADVSKATAAAALVSARLLGECHRSSIERARFADEAAAAGERCERWADSIATIGPAASAPQP